MPLVSELLERWDRDDAKEKFVNYCFNMRDTLQMGKFKEKFKPGQEEDIEALLQKTLDLLNSPQSRFGTEEDFSGMQKELEEHLTPITMEVYHLIKYVTSFYQPTCFIKVYEQIDVILLIHAATHSLETKNKKI